MHSADRAFIAETTAKMLLEVKAVLFSEGKPFIFTSGWASPVYIDCRKLIFYPRIRTQLVDFATSTLSRDAGFEQFDVVAGGETAGIPYAAWIADRLGLPMQYIRKKPKGFGRNAQIEGDIREGALAHQFDVLLARVGLQQRLVAPLLHLRRIRRVALGLLGRLRLLRRGFLRGALLGGQRRLDAPQHRPLAGQRLDRHPGALRRPGRAVILLAVRAHAAVGADLRVDGRVLCGPGLLRRGLFRSGLRNRAGGHEGEREQHCCGSGGGAGHRSFLSLQATEPF